MLSWEEQDIPDEENANAGVIFSPLHSKIFIKAIDLAIDNCISVQKVEDYIGVKKSVKASQIAVPVHSQYISHRIGSM